MSKKFLSLLLVMLMCLSLLPAGVMADEAPAIETFDEEAEAIAEDIYDMTEPGIYEEPVIDDIPAAEETADEEVPVFVEEPAEYNSAVETEPVNADEVATNEEPADEIAGDESASDVPPVVETAANIVAEDEAAKDAASEEGPQEAETDNADFDDEAETGDEADLDDEAETGEADLDDDEDPDDITLFDSPTNGMCGDNATWSLSSNGVMTISGKGEMWDYRDEGDLYNYHECPWENLKDQITEVVFENGITYVGASAFSSCVNLKKVVFSNSIEMIGNFAFILCSILDDAPLPSGLQGLGQDCFSQCAFTEAYIPDSVTYLDSAYSNCQHLTYVYIGGSKDVGTYTNVNAPFFYSQALEKIDVSPDNIAFKSIDGVLYSKDGKTLVQYPCGKKDTTYRIADGTENIGRLAIDGTVYLKTVIFPYSVKFMDINYSYYGEWYFEGNAPDFDPEAFSGAILTIYYPAENSTWTEEVRQNYCGYAIDYVPYNLTIDINETDIQLYADSVTMTGEEIKPMVTAKLSNTFLTEGVDYKLSYKNNINAGTATVTIEGIGMFTGTKTLNFSITAAPSDTSFKCGNNATWHFDSEGVLTISGKGRMWDFRDDADYFDYHECPWADIKDLIKTVVVKDGITYIGASAFDYCYNLKKAVFSETIETIGHFAFWECEALEDAPLPSGLLYLNQQCFGCSAIKEVYIPESVLYVGDAYIYCSQLTCVHLSCSQYQNVNFLFCNALKTIDIYHVLDKTEAVAATCGKSGNTEYWTCSDCGKTFSDEKGTNEVDAANTFVPALDHDLSYVPAKAATTEAAGNKEYYECTRCHKLFSDAAGKNEITAASVVIAKLSSVTVDATASVTVSNVATGIQVEWEPVDNAAGYLIYRKAGSGSYSRVKTISGGSNTSYTDTTATSNGTRYIYVIYAYAKDNGTTIYTDKYNYGMTYRLTAPTISVTNSASKKMTVKWNKNAKATGYVIQYSLKSSFASSKYKVIYKASTVSQVISSLTKGKTYYVRVCSYKYVGGVAYYSDWSTVKKVKISK